MVDTGIRVRGGQHPTGAVLAGSLVFGIIALILLADYGLHLVAGSVVLLPLCAGMAATIALGSFVVPLLRQLKAGQVIREDGPKAHLQKSGTPTMGGIFIVPVAVAIAVVWTGFHADVVAAGLLTLSFGFVGWLDDWQILRYKSNKGISPTQKLTLLGIAAVAFCTWLAWTRPVGTIELPLHLALPIGFLFFPLALFVLLGSSNATNLTDGLDGLAGGTGAIALLGMALLSAADHTEVAIFCACASGCYLGFLWHNHNPARVFMGDTGSLALGGALAAAALLSNLLWALLIIGAIFVWESVSVIAQVSYFKLTKDANGVGKRLFRMAPYHHHLELSGWHETQIVGCCYLIGAGLVCAALGLRLL